MWGVEQTGAASLGQEALQGVGCADVSTAKNSIPGGVIPSDRKKS